MKNSIANGTKVQIYKQGTKQKLYQLRLIIFDPKKYFVSTDVAKEIWRKADKISKAKMKDEFTSIFATSTVVGRGKNKHMEFNKSVKTAANVIFIVPKKYHREALKAIQELEI